MQKDLLEERCNWMPDLRLYKNKAEGAVKLGHVNNLSHLSWKIRILRCMQLGERLGYGGRRECRPYFSLGSWACSDGDLRSIKKVKSPCWWVTPLFRHGEITVVVLPTPPFWLLILIYAYNVPVDMIYTYDIQWNSYRFNNCFWSLKSLRHGKRLLSLYCFQWNS